MTDLITQLHELIDTAESQARAARALLDTLLVDDDQADADTPPPASSDVDDPEAAADDPVLEHVCQHCDRGFKTMGWLQRHLDKEHPQPSPSSPAGGPFHCDDCDHTADSPIAIARHAFAAHDRRPTKTERTPQVGAA